MRKYIIPHKDNDHRPHLLREGGAISLLICIFAIFSLVLGQSFLLTYTNLAAVVSPILIDLTNKDRQVKNIPPLVVNPVLQRAAELKAKDMATKGYFAHNSPEGLTPWHWFNQAGYNFIYAGENLAINFTESTDVQNAWMNSPGHRNNILNDKFTEIGIATYNGTYEGRPAVFVVQLFGRPTPSSIIQGVQTQLPVRSVRGVSESKSEPEPESEFLAMHVTDENIQPVVPVSYANPLQKLISSPRTVLQYAYGLIGGLVLFMLVLLLTYEFKKYHVKHALYGLGLLFIMGMLGFAYASYSLFSGFIV